MRGAKLDSLKREARGRWREILLDLGVDAGLLDEKRHRSCPFCGGKDRYRFTNHQNEGWYLCNQCGTGDGFELARKVLGLDFAEVLRRVEAILQRGVAPAPRPRKGEGKAHLIYERAAFVCAGDPVAEYLKGRGLNRGSRVLRHHPHVFDGKSGRAFHSMVAPIRSRGDKLVGIHVTHLEQVGGGWRKAGIESPKKQRKIAGTISGGAIRLFKPVDGCIGLAEGIETALAVRQMWGVACWSVMSTAGMLAWQVPEGVSKVIVYADADGNFAGQKAAYSLANRLVVKDGLGDVFVFVPDATGDWLDVLNGGRNV